MASRLLPRASVLTSTITRRPLVSSHNRSSIPLPRIMSESTAAAAAATGPSKFEFLVVVPDKPGTLAKRLEVRPNHFKDLEAFVEAGIYKMGGAVLDEVPVDDQPSSLKFHGSTLVCVASSKEEVIETLKKDVYAVNGVWDMDKVQIWPFKCAFRRP